MPSLASTLLLPLSGKLIRTSSSSTVCQLFLPTGRIAFASVSLSSWRHSLSAFSVLSSTVSFTLAGFVLSPTSSSPDALDRSHARPLGSQVLWALPPRCWSVRWTPFGCYLAFKQPRWSDQASHRLCVSFRARRGHPLLTFTLLFSPRLLLQLLSRSELETWEVSPRLTSTARLTAPVTSSAVRFSLVPSCSLLSLTCSSSLDGTAMGFVVLGLITAPLYAFLLSRANAAKELELEVQNSLPDAERRVYTLECVLFSRPVEIISCVLIRFLRLQ